MAKKERCEGCGKVVQLRRLHLNHDWNMTNSITKRVHKEYGPWSLCKGCVRVVEKRVYDLGWAYLRGAGKQVEAELIKYPRRKKKGVR